MHLDQWTVHVHQVTSFSAGDQAGHMAFSYWFHPPDNLDSATGCAAPYTSGFWPALWAARLPRLRPQEPHEQQQRRRRRQAKDVNGVHRRRTAESPPEANDRSEHVDDGIWRRDGHAAAPFAWVRLRRRPTWLAYGRRRHQLHLKPRARGR